MGERDVQPRQRASEAADDVDKHRVPERFVLGAVLVGIDQDLVDLRPQPVEHVGHHRAPVERHESLVDATHPPALTSREHDAGDIYERDHRHAKKRSPPVNTR